MEPKFFPLELLTGMITSRRLGGLAQDALQAGGNDPDQAALDLTPKVSLILASEAEMLARGPVEHVAARWAQPKPKEPILGFLHRRKELMEKAAANIQQVVLKLGEAGEPAEMISAKQNQISWYAAQELPANGSVCTVPGRAPASHLSIGAAKQVAALNAQIICLMVADNLRPELVKMVDRWAAGVREMLTNAAADLARFREVQTQVNRIRYEAHARAALSVERLSPSRHERELAQGAIATLILPLLVLPPGELARCETGEIVGSIIAILEQYAQCAPSLKEAIEPAALTAWVDSFGLHAGIAKGRARVLGIEPPLVVMEAPPDLELPGGLFPDATLQREAASPHEMTLMSFSFLPLEGCCVFDLQQEFQPDDFLAHSAEHERMAEMQQVFAAARTRLQPSGDQPEHWMPDAPDGLHHSHCNSGDPGLSEPAVRSNRVGGAMPNGSDGILPLW